MGRFAVVLITVAVLFAVASCVALNEPPATIYPSRSENPQAYQIDPFPAYRK